MGFDLPGYLERCKSRVEAYLKAALPPEETFPQPLFRALHYSLFAGGKRIRPAFAFAAAEAAGGEAECAVPFAAALEMIHTYSLIHDDLPAMDDDDLRRGRPTNHKVFGEGMAILAGDALLTDAFAVATAPEAVSKHPAGTVVRVVQELAVAAGSGGMVAGQALDLISEGHTLELATLEFLHTHKTGALIRCAVRIGGIAAGASEQGLAALSRYGERIGLAFQIADDVLDVEGTTQILGKPAGSDVESAKATYPALVGVGESKRLARELMLSGIDAVAPLGEGAEALRALARFVVERSY
ncbi:MAG: polyprenyl synthetase family protein [Deferrisomatales bacterium]